MSIRMLCIGAMAFSMMTGAALAAGSGTSALDNATKMAAFYTDSSMKTMKSEAEFKTAWMTMSKDDQAMMMKECGDPATAKKHDKFCQMAMRLGPK